MQKNKMGNENSIKSIILNKPTIKAAAQPSSPFLKIRANRELPLISDVEEQYAKRIALTALQSEEPVGIDLLEEMAK
nr:arsenite-activated ATPase, ArsA family [Raoultella sp. NCTC 9187]